MQVAETILRQLGGNKFIAMTGAKQFVGSGDSLQFSIPQVKNPNGSRINKVKVFLDHASDTYIVSTLFYDRKALECRVVASESLVYADNLQAVFTTLTGLDTRL